MAAWHRSRRADFGLRVSGLLLCGIAYAAIARLFAMHAPPQTVNALAYALATAGFLCAGTGGSLVMLGHQLFEEIEVGKHRKPEPREIFQPSQTSSVMDSPESRGA